MARGPFRAASVQTPATWVFVCRTCHDEMGSADWPIAAQLALKAKHDPANYDRVCVNLIRGRPPNAIDASDVRKAAKRLKIKLKGLRI